MIPWIGLGADEQAGEKPTDAIGKLFIALPEMLRLDGREN